MTEFSKIRKHTKWYRVLRWMSKHPAWLHRLFRWLEAHTLWLQRMAKRIGRNLSWLRFINPFRYIKRLDWYIIKKFIGTYIYSIALIISISIVVDINENLAKFSEYHAPLKAIVFDYYMNFIPYFANLFSPLFVFIAVIFFTSKLAGNSEIIAMLAAGVSFKRLMRPYMITCILISAVSFYLSGYVIPHSNVILCIRTTRKIRQPTMSCCRLGVVLSPISSSMTITPNEVMASLWISFKTRNS